MATGFDTVLLFGGDALDIEIVEEVITSFNCILVATFFSGRGSYARTGGYGVTKLCDWGITTHRLMLQHHKDL